MKVEFYAVLRRRKSEFEAFKTWREFKRIEQMSKAIAARTRQTAKNFIGFQDTSKDSMRCPFVQ